MMEIKLGLVCDHQSSLTKYVFPFFKTMALATAQIDKQDLKELQASLSSTIPYSVM